MASRVFTSKKADFFLGLVVIQMAIELLFSWGAYSGYNNSAGAFPYWKLLNYLIIPSALWLFISYHTDHNFKFQNWHLSLFIPAALAYLIEAIANSRAFPLYEYFFWPLLTEYLPLTGLLYVLGVFWMRFAVFNRHKAFKTGKIYLIGKIKLISLMSCLSLLGLFWLLFSFVGWSHFEVIEFLLLFFFFGFAFLHFLEGQTFPPLSLEKKNQEFPNYNDDESLKKIEDYIRNQQPFLVPNYPLKDLAKATNLPARYVSFLINHYHQKNYKEFINSFRIEAFLLKVNSEEQSHKTLLGLALESGFSSKSTFNQVFKKQLGMSPSEYLN